MALVRILVFLAISGLAHFVAARWVLSTFSPARRARWRRRVLGTALGLSLFLATTRIIASIFETSAMRSLMAVAMLELGVVVIALIPIGIMTRVAFAASWIARRLAAARDAAPQPEPPSSTRPEPAAAAVETAPLAETVTRRQAIERVMGASIFGATTVALGWGMVRGRHAFAIEEVVVRLKGWPRALEGYTIAQVSDVHVGSFVGDRELDEGFELVMKIRPDLLVATGDLVDFESDGVGALAARMLRANARDGAHAILGNHDHYAGAAGVVQRLRAAGVNVLCNESVRVRTGDGGGFALLGVDDLYGRSHRSAGFPGPDLPAAMRGLPADVPRILLAHQPTYFDESAGRIALQLSGHTHGGQINPGFRPADLVMDYVAGRYERGDSTLWVNRGFGVAGPPSRVGAPPEVTKIVLIGG
jgi:predicted MPP superfamily phosphohydrolase